MSTLEDVFLAINKRAEDAEVAKESDEDAALGTADAQFLNQRNDRPDELDGDNTQIDIPLLSNNKSTTNLLSPIRGKLNSRQGYAPLAQQLKALIKARLVTHTRNIPGLLCFILLPLLVTLAFLAMSAGSMGSLDDLKTAATGGGRFEATLNPVYMNVSRYLPSAFVYTYGGDVRLNSSFPLNKWSLTPKAQNPWLNATDPIRTMSAPTVNYLGGTSQIEFQRVDSNYTLKDTLLYNYSGPLLHGFFALVVSTVNASQSAPIASLNYVSVYNKTEPTTPSISINVMSNLLANTIFNSSSKCVSLQFYYVLTSKSPLYSGFHISTTSRPYPTVSNATTFREQMMAELMSGSMVGSVSDMYFIMSLAFTFCILAATIARSLVHEKELRIQFQLNLMSAGPFTYWLAALIGDFARLFLATIPVFVLIGAFKGSLNVFFLLN